MNGWIKLHRKFQEWEWYQNANTMRVFVHVLLNANHQPKRWQGILIERGQVLTSREHLAGDLKLTVMQVRTALKHLENTREVTIKTTKRYTLITLDNYNAYQCHDDESNQQSNQDLTNKEPTGNQQVTTNKNVRKEECKNTLSPSALEIDFEEAWTAYGKKGSKKTSFGYWKKLSQAYRDQIKLRIPLYVGDQEAPKFQKDFNGWINPTHKRWQNALKSELNPAYQQPKVQAPINIHPAPEPFIPPVK